MSRRGQIDIERCDAVYENVHEHQPTEHQSPLWKSSFLNRILKFDYAALQADQINHQHRLISLLQNAYSYTGT
jgi:hypothetical protein